MATLHCALQDSCYYNTHGWDGSPGPGHKSRGCLAQDPKLRAPGTRTDQNRESTGRCMRAGRDNTSDACKQAGRKSTKVPGLVPAASKIIRIPWSFLRDGTQVTTLANQKQPRWAWNKGNQARRQVEPSPRISSAARVEPEVGA